MVSSREKVARKVFDQAYRRQCAVIGANVKQMIADPDNPGVIRRIHDYLSDQRRTTDQQYDYRYSVLIMVFAGLLRGGWLKEADLEGLREDKIAMIKEFANL